ncbi:Hypothetical predicted protein, partial [Paramuricea clavata]
SDIGINDHHQETIINYLRFARYNRGQCLRSVDACFEEYKDSHVVEDTYTLEEVLEMLESLQSVVRGEVESELINTAHTNVLLLRQVFSQAEKWYLNLQADISELENRELIEEIAKFEEREFSAKKSVSQTSASSKLAQKTKLVPLSDGSGSALLQMKITHVTRKKLAATCDFENIDKEVKSAIIQNCLSKRLRRYALLDSEVTLAKILAKGRAFELSESQVQISVNTSPINMVIDTGASIDIIDELAFNTLQKQRPIALQRSKTQLAQTPRRIPFHMRQKVSDALDTLEN